MNSNKVLESLVKAHEVNTEARVESHEKLENFIMARLESHRKIIATVLTKKNGGYWRIIPEELRWATQTGKLKLKEITEDAITIIAIPGGSGKPSEYTLPRTLIFASVHNVCRMTRENFYRARNEVKRAEIKRLQKEIAKTEAQIKKNAGLLEEKIKIQESLNKR